MLESVEATKISGKTVTDSEGRQIGSVDDIMVNDEGHITFLLVRKNQRANGSGEDETPYLNYDEVDGLYHVPVNAVDAVRDHIIVE